MIMSSLEALNKMIEKYDWVGKEYCRLIGKNESLHKVNQEAFESLANTIKQDLELLEQLKQQLDSLAINNGELVVKITDLQKENQELLVNKNLAQKLAVEYKNNIDKLEKENQELKEELQLTETARQLIYNELKCCSGMSEYIEKLKKAIEILKRFDFDIYAGKCLGFIQTSLEDPLTFDLEDFIEFQEYELLKEVLE